MEGQSNRIQNIAFITVIVGFFLFVLADSGAIQWKKWFTSNQSVQSQNDNEISNLKSQLDDLKSNSKVRRERLHALIDQLHELDKSLDTETDALKKLTIANEKIKAQASMVENQTRKAKRVPATSTDEAFAIRASQWKFESWNQVIEKVQELTNKTGTVETVENENQQTLKFSHQKFFSDKSVYLRPEALRMAQAVAVGATRLGAESIAVAYSGIAETETERARVASRYFKKLVGTSIPVIAKKVPEETIKNPDQIEFWVNLKTEGNP